MKFDATNQITLINSKERTLRYCKSGNLIKGANWHWCLASCQLELLGTLILIPAKVYFISFISSLTRTDALLLQSLLIRDQYIIIILSDGHNPNIRMYPRILIIYSKRA